ncbi:MAG: hypothetical protein HYW63_00745 [Candidatus Levybacteria bacterium]|nr:hypothetical protein [Candidatus Levybacteria bacterium]
MINKKIWAAIGGAALLAAVALPALAATDQGVTATVTPQNISIIVSPTSVDYGTVAVPSVDLVPTGDTIIGATNDGNITETFNIKGANATGTTKTWTIVDGAPGGAETFNYNHKYADCGVGDSTCTTQDAVNNMTTGYETLEAGVAAGSSDYFRLRLSTPTETGGDTSEHSTTVTVQAVAT